MVREGSSIRRFRKSPSPLLRSRSASSCTFAFVAWFVVPGLEPTTEATHAQRCWRRDNGRVGTHADGGERFVISGWQGLLGMNSIRYTRGQLPHPTPTTLSSSESSAASRIAPLVTSKSQKRKAELVASAHLDEELLQKRYVLLVSCSQRGRVVHRQLRRLHENRSPSSATAGGLVSRPCPRSPVFSHGHRRRPLMTGRRLYSLVSLSEVCGDLGYFVSVEARRGIYLGG